MYKFSPVPQAQTRTPASLWGGEGKAWVAGQNFSTQQLTNKYTYLEGKIL